MVNKCVISSNERAKKELTFTIVSGVENMVIKDAVVLYSSNLFFYSSLLPAMPSLM